MLEIKNLYKKFGGIKAVNGCSFSVENNSITALIGPNGAGKTTVFNIVTGFMKPDEGTIVFQNEDITNMKPHKIALLGMSRTFQIIRLFPKMTVLENMLIAMPDINEKIWAALLQSKGLKKTEEELMKKAIELLEFVDLHIKTDELAENLSYGQQKLLEIAKCLASDADLILLDEPAAGINPTMLNKVAKIIKELKKKGKTILFIEHDMNFVMKLADKVVVLDYGEEIAVGKPKEIQKNQKVIDAYLGVD